MKIINYMNYVRQYDPRLGNDGLSEKLLYETTKGEIALAREFDIDSTFLLQYDALIDEKYIELFRSEQDARLELGIWLEIPRPLVEKVGLVWRGNPSWRWDWKVIPGFMMAYTQEERKLLIDEVMGKFREIYGYYPKTVASWLIDSYSADYLTEQYHISTLAICRDQLHTDAYTLIGGYFNQAYYPSRNNLFVPAQSDETRIQTPVFRLLGSDPIHNYDAEKYIQNTQVRGLPFIVTLEPCTDGKYVPGLNEWFARTYFSNENLGFSYAQLGQENSFGMDNDVITPLRKQLAVFTKLEDVQFMTMSAAGTWFKKTYSQTPATCVTAMDDWDRGDEIQSFVYSCQRYTANVFRCEKKIFFRNIYMFDEANIDTYLTTPCDSWEACYENLPIVDTLLWENNEGMILDADGCTFTLEKIGDSVIRIVWNDKYVELREDGIYTHNVTPQLDTVGNLAEITASDKEIFYRYRGVSYQIEVEKARVLWNEDFCRIVPDAQDVAIRFGESSC